MFRNKSEVDKQVSGLLYKAKNEHERNLRCFHIAQQYYKTKDYEAVQRYVTMYLSVRDDSAAAYKLLAQSLEGLGQKEKAIAAYTKSLKLEADQSDLVLKMCELLCDKDVEFDPVLARHWTERASSMFPHSSPVFMLKEKLLSFDSTASSKDLEELLHAELKAKPMDLNVRIKLLKLYAESGRTEMALHHAFEVESRQSLMDCQSWHQCIHNICKAYNRDNFAKCGWEFYIQWISALDRLCALSISENMSYSSDASENIDCIRSFDQAMYHANQCSKRPEILKEFIKHMSAQLVYYISEVFMKRAKKVSGLWKETKRHFSPLLLLASTSPPQLDQSWTLSLKDNHRKLVQLWVYQAQCRIVQSGHVLLCLVKENQSEKMFLDRVNHFISSNWRNQIYKKLFDTGESEFGKSHFMTGAEFSKVSLKIPSCNSLKPSIHVSSFESAYFGSLHHLVWLGLRALKKASILELRLTSIFTTSFKALQFTINNLDNIAVETINQLDVDSFLYATVFSTASILADQKINGYFSEDRPQTIPADISPPLCSPEQAKWWSNLCNLVKGNLSAHLSSNESLSDVRFSLQRGLEVVRGEGLSPFLTVALARTFAARAEASNVIEESEGCQVRAFHLWRIVYPLLERMASNKSTLAAPKTNIMFEYPLKEVNLQEAKLLFEEAKFFIGSHYMNIGKFEKAVEELRNIKTPQAVFTLATVYQKWAEDQVGGLQGDEITSEIRCRHVILATKARDYLLSARAMIKNDSKHPLHSNVEAKIFDVEDMLSRVENDISEKDANGTSDESASYESGASPLSESLNVFTSTGRRNLHHASTPLRIVQDQKPNHFNMSELIDLLRDQQNTYLLKVQQITEQIKLVTDKLEVISSEQRSQKNLVDGLNSQWNSFESEMKNGLADLRKDMKRPELCNMFDEEDYTDEMLQYQSYPQYYGPTQRVVQNSNTPAAAVPFMSSQYFSPRIDTICTGFYNTQQGALPFSEGQQLPDFLRQPKPSLSQPVLHSMQTSSIGVPPPLNLATGVAGPSRVGTVPSTLYNYITTTANTLPTASPLELSVSIPASRSFVSNPSNAPHNFQIPLPPQSKTVFNVEERFLDEETPPPTYDHDPLPDYKPQIPLPDEVEVCTGEEDEEIIFEKRAKLYRLIDRTWKERGIGNLKILKNRSTGKTRIIMRREQVHKICANHFLAPDMKLNIKQGTENVFIWSALDFADEVPKPELLCAKFKTKEDGEEFKKVFDKTVEELIEKTQSSDLVKQVEPSDNSPISTQPMSSKIKVTTVFTPNTSFEKNNENSNKTTSLFGKGPFSASGFGGAPTFASPQSSILPNTSIFSKESTSPALTATLLSTPFPNIFTSSSTASTQSPKQPLFQSLLQVQDKPTQSSMFGGFTGILLAPQKLKEPEKPKIQKNENSQAPSPLINVNFPVTDLSPKAIFSNAFSTINTSAKPSIFSNSDSNVVLGKVFSSHSKPVEVTRESADKISAKNESFELVTQEDRDTDQFVPTATFEPTIPLPSLITIKTGEEDEEILFDERACLYRFVKETSEWKERGIGAMKILRHKENGAYRLLMRREQVLKVCCNHRITPDIKMRFLSSSTTAVSWAAKDNSEDQPTDELFSLKFKTTELAKRFMETFESIQSKLLNEPLVKTPVRNDKPPLSSVIKKPPGSWECTECYTSNKAENVSCAACSNPKSSTFTKNNDKLSLSEIMKPTPGSWECKECYVRNKPEVDVCAACNKPKEGAVKSTLPSSTTPTFSFGMVPSNTSLTNKEPFTFGTLSSDVPNFNQSAAEKQPFSFGFGSAEGKQKDPPSIFGSSINPVTISNNGFVFSSSPAQQNKSANNEPSFGSASFQFSMPMPAITSTEENKSPNDDSYDPEEEEDNVQFQPAVVSLPDKIDVKTGEENENVLYSHRAKLYRFDTSIKDWKERGVGDIKILDHIDTGKIRFLMRREPILKVCLNHNITEDISLRPKDDKSWIWYALDYSEGLQTEEKFAIRFKSPDVAQEFLKEFNKAKLLVTERLLDTSKEEGTHEIEKSKEDAQDNRSGSDSDVEFVSEQKAPPELVKKALMLKLPPNYYCYLENPPCPGCPGCSDEEDDEVSGDSNTDKNEPTAIVIPPEEKGKVLPPQENIFGSVFGLEKKPAAQTIFGSTTTAPAAAGFVFGQRTTFKPEDSYSNQTIQSSGITSAPSLQGGFFFKDKTSFSSTEPTTNIFSAGLSNTEQNTSKQQKEECSVFGQIDKNQPGIFGQAVENQSKEEMPGYLAKEYLSFGALGSKQEQQAFCEKKSENFNWGGAGEKLFANYIEKKANVSATSKNDDEDDDDDGDKDNQQANEPYFEPVIPLPAKIVVLTGEEDEEILFNERGILYRFDSTLKVWKERGIGQMKVLKHKETNNCRLLMRREAVHKIVCNQCINEDLEMKNNSQRSFCWNAFNYCDDNELKIEQLSIKFKNDDIASNFLKAVNNCIQISKDQSSGIVAKE